MPRTTKNDPQDAIRAMIAEAVADALANATGPAVFADEPKKRTTKATKATKATKRTTKPAKNVITCEMAWLALGANETYRPSQPDSPARNGQLWALNAAGLLSLRA